MIRDIIRLPADWTHVPIMVKHKLWNEKEKLFNTGIGGWLKSSIYETERDPPLRKLQISKNTHYVVLNSQ